MKVDFIIILDLLWSMLILIIIDVQSCVQNRLTVTVTSPNQARSKSFLFCFLFFVVFFSFYHFGPSTTVHCEGCPVSVSCLVFCRQNKVALPGLLYDLHIIHSRTTQHSQSLNKLFEL